MKVNALKNTFRLVIYSAAVTLVFVAHGQAAPVYQAREAEPVAILLGEKLNDALRSGLTDPFLVAVLKDTAVAVPLLAEWLREGTSTHTLNADERFLVEDALAYVATPDAIREIGSLAEEQESMSFLVQRCLDYSIGRGNPFQLAYAAVDSGLRAKEQTREWILRADAEGKGYSQWALAIRERLKRSGESVWRPAADPLVQLLPESRPPAGLTFALEREGVRRAED